MVGTEKSVALGQRRSTSRISTIERDCLGRCVVFFAMLTLPHTIAEASFGLRTVALSGTPAPGTDRLFEDNSRSVFGSVAINQNGETAFRAEIETDRNRPPFVLSGLWSEGGSSGLRFVAGERQIAPGTAENAMFGRFSTLSMDSPVISDTGQVAFTHGFLRETSPNAVPNHGGIWKEDSENALGLLARDGEQIPGTDSVFFHYSQLQINNDGLIAFRGSFDPTEVGEGSFSSFNSAIWREDANGSLRTVAKTSDPAPQTAVGANFRQFKEMSFSNQGHTAFIASLTGAGVNGTNDSGIWREESDNSLSLLAREGTPVPDVGADVAFGNLDRCCEEVRLVINSVGDVFFPALLSGPGINTDTESIWIDESGVGLSLIARAGDQAPGVAVGERFGGSGSSFQSPVLNDLSRVAFTAALNGETIHDSNDSGIWHYNKQGGLELAVREGERSPGTEQGITFGRYVLHAFDELVLNQQDQLAFVGYLEGDGIDASNDSGIWAEDVLGNLQLIAREGDLLDVSDDPSNPDMRIIRELKFIGVSGNEYGRSGFNDRGQVAFVAEFIDRTSGVFVSNRVAVPEPAALILLVLGCFTAPRRIITA